MSAPSSSRARSSSTNSHSPRARPRPLPPPNPPDPPLTLLSTVNSRMQEQARLERYRTDENDIELGAVGGSRSGQGPDEERPDPPDGSQFLCTKVPTNLRPLPWHVRFRRRIGRGIYDDIRARAPYYLSDWTDAWNYRVIPATWVSDGCDAVHFE